MVPGTHVKRTIGLSLLLLAGLAYLALSFHPRIRFADPAPNESAANRRSYHCYYDKLYGNSPNPDVLFFGASKTYYAVDAASIEAVYKAVTGKPLDAFVFDTFGTNPGIVYFFFRDYLAHNPAPEMAFFELTENSPNYYWSVRYINLLMADLSPPYLYLDVLRSWEVVNSELFAASNFLRLVIRHIDLSLSRLLVAKSHFLVPSGNNCRSPARDDPGHLLDQPGQKSFAQLLDAEMDSLMPTLDRQEIGSKEALLDTYEHKPLVRRRVGERGTKWLGSFDQHFWRDRGQLKQRSLDYFHRVVALGKAHGVKVAFYYLPLLLAPEPREEDVRQLSELLGAPVYILPYGYTRIAYHHYRDGAHVNRDMRVPYATWFAGVVDRVREH